jgi:hypothetical protein
VVPEGGYLGKFGSVAAAEEAQISELLMGRESNA